MPNGYEGMKLAVDLAVPEAYHEHIDVDAVEAVFPYGEVRVELQPGGAAPRIAIPVVVKTHAPSSRCAGDRGPCRCGQRLTRPRP